MADFQPAIVDVEGHAGAYGGDAFAQAGVSFAEKYPYQVQDFAAVAAPEGPQVILTWTRPALTVERIQVRRKQGEYPRDNTDGVLVHDTAAAGVDLNTEKVLDIGQDLVVTPGLGDSAWWYYRVFTKPAQLALSDQFGGLAAQDLTFDNGYTTLSLDVQQYATVTVRAEDTSGAGQTVSIYTSPTSAQVPAVLVSTIVLAPSETQTLILPDNSYKYVHAKGTAGAHIWFIVNRDTPWQTSMAASAPALAYRSGYHMDVWWNHFHVPDVWRSLDDVQGRADRLVLEPIVSIGGSVANLWEPQDRRRGPLFRVLKLLSLELDRVRAYMDSITAFDANLDTAPAHVLQHAAYAMGWSVDTTRPLVEVRDELLRIPFMWKAKGTPWLLEVVAAQVYGVAVRVQEGPGLVACAADPAQWGNNPDAGLMLLEDS